MGKTIQFQQSGIGMTAIGCLIIAILGIVCGVPLLFTPAWPVGVLLTTVGIGSMLYLYWVLSVIVENYKE